MLTLFAAVVLIVCGILLIAIVGMFIAYARGQVDELGSAGVAILGGFGLAVLAVAYWSGSWLFRGDDAPVSQRAAESTGRSVELADDYPGAWQSDAPGNIIRALAVNDVRGCGEFHHKASVRTAGNTSCIAPATDEHGPPILSGRMLTASAGQHALTPK